jgi:hypothetical protein
LKRSRKFELTTNIVFHKAGEEGFLFTIKTILATQIAGGAYRLRHYVKALLHAILFLV